jgi:hypothetical protein
VPRCRREFVAGHRSLSADSLPGRLSGDAKLKLVQRLLRDGFVVLDDDKNPGTQASGLLHR